MLMPFITSSSVTHTRLSIKGLALLALKLPSSGRTITAQDHRISCCRMDVKGIACPVGYVRQTSCDVSTSRPNSCIIRIHLKYSPTHSRATSRYSKKNPVTVFSVLISSICHLRHMLRPARSKCHRSSLNLLRSLDDGLLADLEPPSASVLSFGGGVSFSSLNRSCAPSCPSFLSPGDSCPADLPRNLSLNPRRPRGAFRSSSSGSPDDIELIDGLRRAVLSAASGTGEAALSDEPYRSSVSRVEDRPTIATSLTESLFDLSGLPPVSSAAWRETPSAPGR